MAKQLTIGEKIKALRLAKGLSVPAFAKKYNLNKENLHTKPSRHEDYVELEKILFMENVPRATMLNEEEAAYDQPKKDNKSKELHSSSRAMDTIYTLSESNKIAIQTNADLAALLKAVTEKSTAGSTADTLKDVYAKLDNLLAMIAAVAAGERYESQQEAIATLGRKFYLNAGT